MQPEILLEVCIDSPTGAWAAQEGGANRVELCAGLVEGGITPSSGTIRLAREVPDMDLMVMIRPRGGDFLYSDREFRSMILDIEEAKNLGADGVVFGLLTPKGEIDEQRTEALIRAAKPLRITFHRAFDMTSDPNQSLEQLIDLGVDRVLTSGQQSTAPDGSDLIRALVERAADRIIILPGGGIREQHVEDLVRKTGVRELHFTAETSHESPMQFRNPRVYMGAGPPPGEYELKTTDSGRVADFVRLARDLATSA